jgi:nucleoside-diphosphate-sugar epimerase
VSHRQRNDWIQIEGNLHATLALLMVAAEAGCASFIGAGSQAEYGPQRGALDEQAPTRPTTLYGATKLATYHLASQLATQHRVRFAWLRIFSTYGPKDNHGRMLPDVIRAMLRKERPSLTAGEQHWDYLHVADAAQAFFLVGRVPSALGVFNLGSGKTLLLRELITRLRDSIDPGLPLGFGEVPYRPDQVMWLQADTRRLQTATGWRPRRTIEEGLAETLAWHLAHTGLGQPEEDDAKT